MGCRYPDRRLIGLVEKIWDIECRRLLGILSAAEGRQAVAAALAAGPLPVHREICLAMEVDRD